VFPTLERVVVRWPSPLALLDLFFPSGDGKWVCEGLLARARHGVGSTNGPALLTFASPSETLSGLRCPLVRSVELGWPNGLLLSAFAEPGLLSWGCHRSAPPSVLAPGVHSQCLRCSEELPSACLRRDLLMARCHLRPGAATFRTRSALAVPPGCDGFLHLALFRFVAP
jgi:hypothetical protein